MSYAVFLAELRKLGFTEGHNLTIDHRRIDEGAAKTIGTTVPTSILLRADEVIE
jgi:hypothetical protein